MAVKRKTEAGAPAFTGAQLLTFDRYRERRVLLSAFAEELPDLSDKGKKKPALEHLDDDDVPFN